MDTSIAQKLTSRVEAAIKTILGAESDEFDAPDFDVVGYVNQHFPDEKSLGGLDSQIASMELEIRELDNSILGACRPGGFCLGFKGDLRSCHIAFNFHLALVKLASAAL